MTGAHAGHHDPRLAGETNIAAALRQRPESAPHSPTEQVNHDFAGALGEIPGILRTPGSAPVPLILLGHPGGLHTMYPRLVARAWHAAAEGFAAATIELPGSGDWPRPAAAEQARADLRRALAAGVRRGPAGHHSQVLLQWDDEGLFACHQRWPDPSICGSGLGPTPFLPCRYCLWGSLHHNAISGQKECFMKVRPWRARLVAFIAGAVCLTTVTVSAALPAYATPSITIHLTNATSWCADVKDNRNVAGQPVWLYKCSQGNNDHWFEGTPTPNCDPDACIIFIDEKGPQAPNDALCLALSDTQHAVLGHCYNIYAWWGYNDVTHNLRNFGWTSDNLIAQSTVNGSEMFGCDCTQDWHQWTGP